APATTALSTLSLHDALPISSPAIRSRRPEVPREEGAVSANGSFDEFAPTAREEALVVEDLADETLVYDLDRDKAHSLNATAAAVDRKSTRLNSSHVKTSYAV